MIVVVDPFARIDTQAPPGGRAVISASDLPTLFQHWEIDYGVENVIADLKNSHILRSGIQMFSNTLSIVEHDISFQGENLSPLTICSRKLG